MKKVTIGFLSRERFSFAANSFFGYSKYRAENPIYNKNQEDIYFSLEAMVDYKNPWGWKIGNSEPMAFFLNMAIYRSDTNIDFYYKDAFLITGGVFSGGPKTNNYFFKPKNFRNSSVAISISSGGLV